MGEIRWKERPVFLLIVLFLMLLSGPAFEATAFGRAIMVSFFMLLVLASTLAVLRSRWLVVTVLSIGLPWVALSWVGVFCSLGVVLGVVRSILQITVTLLIAISWVMKTLRNRAVTGDTLCRAVSAYILIGIAWAAIYEGIGLLDPTAFHKLAPGAPFGGYLYLSFSVLTTLGLGDITPVAPWARSLVTLEAVIGPVYLAVLIARLVVMYERSEDRTPHAR